MTKVIKNKKIRKIETGGTDFSLGFMASSFLLFPPPSQIKSSLIISLHHLQDINTLESLMFVLLLVER